MKELTRISLPSLSWPQWTEAWCLCSRQERRVGMAGCSQGSETSLCSCQLDFIVPWVQLTTKFPRNIFANCVFPLYKHHQELSIRFLQFIAVYLLFTPFKMLYRDHQANLPKQSLPWCKHERKTVEKHKQSATLWAQQTLSLAFKRHQNSRILIRDNKDVSFFLFFNFIISSITDWWNNNLRNSHHLFNSLNSLFPSNILRMH